MACRFSAPITFLIGQDQGNFNRGKHHNCPGIMYFIVFLMISYSIK